ncbi:MAG TPA: hypothetical protein VIZ17_03695 [Acetobacteraceae bacterium]
MRRALGLGGDQQRAPQPPPSSPDRLLLHRPKRRFVAEGEVPVVHGRLTRRDESPQAAAPPTNRVEAAETAARAERDARDKAERLLAEAQAAVHDLQTRLGHAQLAVSEGHQALEAEKSAAAALNDQITQLEARLAEVAAERDSAEQELQAVRATLADMRQARDMADRTTRPVIARPVVTVRGRKPATSPQSRAAPTTSAQPKAATRSAKPATARAEAKPVKWWLKSKQKTTKRR